MTTLRKVIDALAAEGVVSDADYADIAQIIATPTSSAETPWYIRAFLGVSAWIAASLLLLFLFGMDLISSETSAIILGLILVGSAIGLRRLRVDNTFVGQLALALSLTGQVLFIGGIGTLLESVTATALAVVVLESLLIALYPDQFQRFLSTILIIGALVAVVFDWEAQLAIHALLIATIAGALLLWERESQIVAAKAEDVLLPVGYGLVISAFGLINLQLAEFIGIRQWWLSALGLLLVLIVQVYWLLRFYRVRITGTLAAGLVAGGLVLGAAALHTPGLLVGLIVLLLGFRRGNRLLMGLAAVFLVFFIAMFYYTLTLTLLWKSLALIGSGIALFGLRWAAISLTPPQEGT